MTEKIKSEDFIFVGGLNENGRRAFATLQSLCDLNADLAKHNANIRFGPFYDRYGVISENDMGVDYCDQGRAFGVKIGLYVLEGRFLNTEGRPKFKRTLNEALRDAEESIDSLYWKGRRT